MTRPLRKARKGIEGGRKINTPSQIAPVFDISPEGKLIFGLSCLVSTSIDIL